MKSFGEEKETRASFFNARRVLLSLFLPLLLCEDDDDDDDDDEFDDFRFGSFWISFSLSRGESGRYRKKKTFFFFFFFFFSWSRQENGNNSWGEKRQTTTAAWDDGERE